MKASTFRGINMSRDRLTGAAEELSEDYRHFGVRVAGDEHEDYSAVFTRVRLQRLPETQKAWANMPTTREFCKLGLHLLYRRHFHDHNAAAGRHQAVLLPALSAEEMADHAQVVIRDQTEADRLSKQRWADTWSNQSNFLEDTIAFLFRPAPFVVRTGTCQRELGTMIAGGMRLGEFVRAGVEAEMASNLGDPLVALQTFVETALPGNAVIRRHAQRLDDTIIDLWAALYRRVFPAYGLRLRPGAGWHDLARTFTVVAHGELMRARLRPGNELDRLSNGDDVLSTVILGLLSSHFDIAADEVESRRLVAATPDLLAPAG
jgi:hypothetical protein